MNLKWQWWLFSVAALSTVGAGVSILGEAIRIRTLNLDGWFTWGTLGLVVLNTGLCLLGQAIYLKVKINLKEQLKK